MRCEAFDSCPETLEASHRLIAKALLFALPIFVGGLQAQTAGGSISGTVSVQNGASITGATVLYGKLAAARKNGVPIMTAPVASVTTGVNGVFSISGLAAATYLLCVQVPAAGYLDPCHWSTTPPTVAVAAGQAVSGVSIHVSKGAVLTVPVLDPQQMLVNSTATSTMVQAVVAEPKIGVVAVSGALVPGVLVGSTGAGKTYAITLPFDTATGVFVLGGGYQIVQAGASAVPSGGQTIQVTASSSGQLPSLSFTVTGLAASAASGH